MRRFVSGLFAISLALSITGLAGCAASAQNTGNSKQPKQTQSRLVCKKETVVGSHVPRTVCRDTGLADQERERDQKAVQDIQRGNYYIREGNQ